MNKKVCVFDIDGVLNYYPDTWVNFVNKSENTKFSNLYEIKESFSYAKYKRMKEKYRLSGIKAELVPREGIVELIRILKMNGYIIVIISARPVEKYPDLYKQTTKWLDSNGIIYDNLIFSDKKQFEVIKYYPHMSFMVEDNRLIANIMSDLGYRVYLLDNQYNQGNISLNVVRVKTIEEVFKNACKQ